MPRMTFVFETVERIEDDTFPDGYYLKVEATREGKPYGWYHVFRKNGEIEIY